MLTDAKLRILQLFLAINHENAIMNSVTVKVLNTKHQSLFMSLDICTLNGNAAFREHAHFDKFFLSNNATSYVPHLSFLIHPFMSLSFLYPSPISFPFYLFL